MAFFSGDSRKSSVISGLEEYVAAQPYTSIGGKLVWFISWQFSYTFSVNSATGFDVIPEEVELTHAPSGIQLGGSQRLADSAYASWRCGNAPSLSLTSGLSLSTRSSDVDLKEFLVKRGRRTCAFLT